MNDESLMHVALAEAMKAAKKGEVPIGAVAVADCKVIARAHNMRERTNNPLGHAELLLLQKLAKSKKFKSWRLNEVTVYVTCEPCSMCMGALTQARVGNIVYGCDNPNWGQTNPKPKMKKGVLTSECAAILSNFFKTLRKRNKTSQIISCLLREV